MNNTERTYYDDGKLRGESAFVNGVPHGLHRQWHPNSVLAMEIPYDHGMIDGTVKQWNDKGEMISTSELRKGTGVLRTLYPEQGTDGEMTYVDGKLTGRQLAFCGGELMAITYWLDDKKVSRKRYVEACKTNKSLPHYEDDRKLGQTWLQYMEKLGGNKPTNPQAAMNELPLKLLQGPRAREAKSWLKERRQPSRTLGEATGQDESIRLVDKLYSLGAVAVHAVEINGGPSEDQNTGRLVIELPQDQNMRGKVLSFCGNLASEMGFDPDQDMEQRYVLLMLD